MINTLNNMTMYALQRHLRSGNDKEYRNLGFSSVLGAAQLGIVLAGQTKTSEQKEVLAVFESKDSKQVISDLGKLMKSLPRPLVTANAAWVKTATKEYKNLVAPITPYVISIPSNVRAINSAIEEKTGVRDLVDEDDLGSRTEAVLISTMTLEDKWKHGFTVGCEGSFQVGENDELIENVVWMENKFLAGQIKHLDKTDREYVALDYENDAYAAVLVKTDELEHLRICPNEITELLRTPSKRDVKVIVPNLYDIKCEIDFKRFCKSAYSINDIYSGFEFNGVSGCEVSSSIIRTTSSFNMGGASFVGAAKSVVKTRGLTNPNPHVIRFDTAYIILNVRKSDGLIVSLQYISHPGNHRCVTCDDECDCDCHECGEELCNRTSGMESECVDCVHCCININCEECFPPHEDNSDWKEDVCLNCYQPRSSTAHENDTAAECELICDGDGLSCECEHHNGPCQSDTDSEYDSDDDSPLVRRVKRKRESSQSSSILSKKARVFIDLTA